MSGLQATQVGSAQAQRLLLPALDSRDPVARVVGITAAQHAVRVRDAGWTTYKRLSFHHPAELALRHEYEASTRRSIAIGARLSGLDPADPATTVALAENDREADQGRAILDRLIARYEPLVDGEGHDIVSGIATTRTATYVSYGTLTVLFTGIGLVITRAPEATVGAVLVGSGRFGSNGPGAASPPDASPWVASRAP